MMLGLYWRQAKKNLDRQGRIKDFGKRGRKSRKCYANMKNFLDDFLVKNPINVPPIGKNVLKLWVYGEFNTEFLQFSLFFLAVKGGAYATTPLFESATDRFYFF